MGNLHWLCETGDAPFCKKKTRSHERWVTWLDGCGQLNSHFAKIGGHYPSEGRGKNFFWSYDQWLSNIYIYIYIYIYILFIYI